MLTLLFIRMEKIEFDTLMILILSISKKRSEEKRFPVLGEFAFRVFKKSTTFS